MDQDAIGLLENRLDGVNFKKLIAIDNPMVHDFVAKYVELCRPASVFVCTDDGADIDYIRKAALANKEEAQLAGENHTVHFDNFRDQGRDKENTKFLLPETYNIGPEINAMPRDKGLKEIHRVLHRIMKGKELYIRFFCLGPTGSPFTIPCLQLTDSAYVAHSEDLLYRQGYEEFIRNGNKNRFFRFVHSQGRLEEAGLGLMVSRDLKKRRVYIDLLKETVFSTNTQYGGNTIGMKKLALRLAIKRASDEGWLAEHMLLMGIKGDDGSMIYFTGAFPSMCGKTSTATIGGDTILGDDIALLKKIDGKIMGVNMERGIFGIMPGINASDDATQWKALHSDAEIIFSNVLVTEGGKPYWDGMSDTWPDRGINHSGDWFNGKKDDLGRTIPPAHKNARFSMPLEGLEIVDPNLHNPNGVEVSGIIFGGRDSDTFVPVEESFNWLHGVITKAAALESETTAATLGKRGVRIFNPMSNIDFLSIPIGTYIKNHLDFGGDLHDPPRIFSVNYFLKDMSGQYLNHKSDKRVWVRWMDKRVRNQITAIRTPTGLMPYYDDLVEIFGTVFPNVKYTEEEYISQFTLRIPQHLAKIKRTQKMYAARILYTPPELFEVLEEQRERLEDARDRYGNYVSPFKF
ncbi:MAG: phosphoenolpyruvate carboxykinase (GTP) [Thermoplasmata archaeon]|nr:phosphoenolpyruvate carboxykinase (GTP) [Thermoplasmata archaeon]